MSNEVTLMLRGASALLSRRVNIDPLVEADVLGELKTNDQLRRKIGNSPKEIKQYQENYKPTVVERIRLLRRSLFGSLVLLLTATIIALIIARITGRFAPAWIAIASVFLLAWSTVARLGYAGRSWGKITVVERLDERIFKTLFWLGTFFGILALTSGS
jgi:hypothetical protein